MPDDEPTFEIDDELSLADNLEAFSEALKQLDTEAAAILIPQLSAFADGQLVERGELLDALYAATDPTQGDSE